MTVEGNNSLEKKGENYIEVGVNLDFFPGQLWPSPTIWFIRTSEHPRGSLLWITRSPSLLIRVWVGVPFYRDENHYEPYALRLSTLTEEFVRFMFSSVSIALCEISVI
jgi:hypothetical protein